MARGLTISIGQHSEQGRKATNQDFHGAVVPDGSALALKGAAIALADGIGSSPVGHLAAETAVKSFLTDYYCTSDAWSVKTSGGRVIAAANAWLHAETRRGRHADDRDKGFVCTFDALVLKARSAHLFHVGDARIYRLSGDALEPLTEDHRVVLSSKESYLGRALGMAADVEIDYRALPLAVGDVFVLATDGVCEHIEPRAVAQAIGAAADLDAAARRIAQTARCQGSLDDLTVQIVRIDALPEPEALAFASEAEALPAPPLLEAPTTFEGYRVLRRLHVSSRSHIYLASDAATGRAVALKLPASDIRDDAMLLRQFMMEEWVARRVDSAHVLKALPPARARAFLYVVMEHVEGQTLRQWMHDNPAPNLEAVRGIVEQIVRGLRAFHRKEMVHRDLRPENVMIDREGTVKIIDFGATRVAGVVEAAPEDGEEMLGTLQYTAPECLVGDPATDRSDLYALGVIVYEMLTGRLPYGAAAPRVRTRAEQRRLRYVPALGDALPVPAWIDGALRKAVHPDPLRRHDALSEFVADLRTPNPRYAKGSLVPLAERDPVRFWQGVSLLLAGAVVFLLLVLAA